MTSAATPSPEGPREFRVRRLPDTRGFLRTRRNYEVGCFAAGSDTPLSVHRTHHPGSVLRGVGVHPSDVHDHVAMADAAWHGGVGPWRSAFSSGHEDSEGRGLERAGQQRSVRAQDLGLPTIRVRRLPDTGPFGPRRTYEVELTEVGADSPSWTRTTHTPRPLIEPHLGWDEAPTVIDAADRAWTGGVGPWATLFPGDAT